MDEFLRVHFIFVPCNRRLQEMEDETNPFLVLFLFAITSSCATVIEDNEVFSSVFTIFSSVSSGAQLKFISNLLLYK